MNRIFLIACILCQFTAQSQYQVQKGHWFISHIAGGYGFTKNEYKEINYDGSGEFSSTKENMFRFGFSGPDWGSVRIGSSRETDENPNFNSKNNVTELWFQPQAGYFVRDNLMIGASMVAGFRSYKFSYSKNISKDRYWAIGIGPLMKYYIGKHANRKAFAGFESRFEITREKDFDYYNDGMSVDENKAYGKGSRWMIKPFAGYAWFLGKRWTADLRIDYTYMKESLKYTGWLYEDGTLDPGYPRSEKYETTVKVLALSMGICYTF